MGGPRDYHIKWNRSDRERQLSHDIVSIWNLKINNINELIYKTDRLREWTYHYPGQKEHLQSLELTCTHCYT